MDQQQKAFLSISIVLLLVAISIYLIIPPSESTRLGLDLKGGMNIILTAIPSPDAPVSEEAMEQAMLIIRQRVDKLGVAEPDISRQGKDNILIQLPGVKHSEEALEIIGKPAFLEFKKVLDADGDGEPDEDEEGNLILGETVMTGKYLKDVRVIFDQTGTPGVSIEFTKEGGKKFEEVTGSMIGELLAIVLDGELMSAPVVQEKISPPGGAEITGKFTVEEAKRLRLVLQTGALPVKLELAENRTVGPSLGEDSLKAGLRAGIFGLLLVLLYMVLYYRALGVVTCLALTVFSILFWGVIVSINKFTPWGWPLTLPGIAGIILSIGLVADSSVVIFERIKEEVNLGKTMRSAAESGFSHGFKTMVDADLVTLIGAIILIWVGIGPVRGFAVSLAVGISIDLFITYFFSRPILMTISQFKILENPVFIGAKGVDAE
ncbi:MAG: protein translocase subunit SecD [Actinomycetia bacterium]|nr:protein translocase subunit SecD [Actinomycetes bacterium]